MQRRITVSVKVPGFHRWPTAPKEVDFLAATHRHLFGIKATYEVAGPDRQLEFFILRSELMLLLCELFGSTNSKARKGRSGTEVSHGFDFGNRSCEAIAEALLRADDRACKVVVDEDGENSAEVSWSDVEMRSHLTRANR